MGNVVRVLPSLVDSVGSIVEMFRKHNKPKKSCPISKKAIKKMELELFHQYQQELQRRQAELAAQAEAIASQADQLNEKMEEISLRDDQSKLEQAKIDAQLEARHKIREKDLIEWLRQQAAQQLGLDYVNEYNIGVSGPSRSGKSTMINGFRGLQSSDPGAARVDFNECTQGVTKYQFPDPAQLMIWDCPGAGTMTHPLATYFYDKFLFAFDYLIFVFSDGVREIEIDLMKQAIAHQVPFCFVRNKANDDLRNKLREESLADKAIALSAKIKHVIDQNKKVMREQLEKAGIDASNMPPLFVINSWALTDENEVRFEEADLVKHVLETVYQRRNGEEGASASVES